MPPLCGELEKRVAASASGLKKLSEQRDLRRDAFNNAGVLLKQFSETCKLMNASMIALIIFGGHIPYSNTIRKIGAIMRQMDFKFVHKRTGDYYKVVEIPFDQQQNYIATSEDVEFFNTESSQSSENEELALPF